VGNLAQIHKVEHPDPIVNRIQDNVRDVVNPIAATVAKLKPPSYIELIENNETGSVITITTSGTFYQWTTGTPGESSDKDFAFPGVMSSVVIGPAGAGVYIVSSAVAGTLSGPSAEIQMVVFLDGSQTHMRMDTDSITAAAYQTIAITGTLTLAPHNTVTVRFSSSANGRTFTIKHMNFNLHRIA
jgi:hypothetical protein